MSNEFLITLFRTALGFVLLLFLTRLIGNKQLGQLNVFTYISGIAMGNMAGDMIIHRDVKLWDCIGGMILWGVFTLTVELVSLKSTKARVMLDGEPVIVIKRGEIQREQLKKQRLNLDDLTMLLRVNQIFSLQDVEYAILEPNGELSVMKKQEKESPTREELQIQPTIRFLLPCEIISDGKLVEKNLTEIGRNQGWLMDSLAKQGISQIKDVFYGELQADGTLFVQKY